MQMITIIMTEKTLSWEWIRLNLVEKSELLELYHNYISFYMLHVCQVWVMVHPQVCCFTNRTLKMEITLLYTFTPSMFQFLYSLFLPG